MDTIYGNAVLTIDAATGTDANAGLAGIHPGSRNIDQLLVEFLPGRQLVTARPILTEVADASFWNTRAWTYQERFLSKRSLIFTEQGAFFQCQRMLWCEDVVAEDEQIIDYYQMEDYLPIDWSAEHSDHMYKLHYALHLQRSPNWVEYLRTIEEYTPRALSNEADVLAAFAGMNKVLASMFHTPLLFGLPELLFDCALLWHPAGTLVRRQFSGSPLSNGDDYFPSWSWMGWKGAIVHEDITPHLKMLSSELVRRTKRLVRWHKQMGPLSQTATILSAGEVGKYMLEPFDNELPTGWHASTGGMFDVFIGTYYYHDAAPLNFSAIPAPATAKTSADDMLGPRWTCISGTTWSARLHITPAAHQEAFSGSTWRFSLRDDAGSWCGSVWLDAAWSKKGDRNTRVRCPFRRLHTQNRDRTVLVVRRVVENFWKGRY